MKAIYLLIAIYVQCSVAQFNFIEEIFGGGSHEDAPYNVTAVFHENSRENRYEERVYPATKWVCTDQSSTRGAFMALFRYITGQNEREESIKMTAPVTTEWVDGSGTMCFYLGAKHQSNPPAPTNPSVRFEDRPNFTIFTRQFGGWPSHSVYRQEFEELSALVQQDGHNAAPNRYYEAGYQSPMQLFNRRNELWVVKQ